jgi:hypothetical protein
MFFYGSYQPSGIFLRYPERWFPMGFGHLVAMLIISSNLTTSKVNLLLIVGMYLSVFFCN